jgi:hypothetical protein
MTSYTDELKRLREYRDHPDLDLEITMVAARHDRTEDDVWRDLDAVQKVFGDAR